MVHWSSNPIVSCTAVCSSSSSVDANNSPSIPNKQSFTVSTILPHSGPGDVWGWFTSCIAKQSQIQALI